MASFSARREDRFQKRSFPKRIFLSDFVKLGSEILYLCLAEKMVVRLFFLFACFVCCNFVRFWLTLKKIEAFIELRKKFIRCTAWDLLNPDSADLLNLQR